LYSLEDLQTLMKRLRDPEGGCPWDLQQNYASIAPSTLEEAYEVADTIERNDLEHLPEELGDLLFQVIFYCQLGSEEQRFSFADVVDRLVAKLLRRHPHVFPDGTLDVATTETSNLAQRQVKASWGAIKATERGEKGLRSILDDVPTALPSLARAQKLQKRLARAGWDWRNLAGVLSKFDEELAEVKQAISEAEANQQTPNESIAVAEELGDLLFMAVNLARFLDHDAETCLRSGNRKFENRVRFMERKLAEAGQTMADQNDDHLEMLWQQAKELEKSTSR